MRLPLYYFFFCVNIIGAICSLGTMYLCRDIIYNWFTSTRLFKLLVSLPKGSSWLRFQERRFIHHIDRDIVKNPVTGIPGWPTELDYLMDTVEDCAEGLITLTEEARAIDSFLHEMQVKQMDPIENDYLSELLTIKLGSYGHIQFSMDDDTHLLVKFLLRKRVELVRCICDRNNEISDSVGDYFTKKFKR